MPSKLSLLALLSALTLAACGGDLVGPFTGAAGGAAVGEAVSDDPLAGAAIGGVAGAALE